MITGYEMCEDCDDLVLVVEEFDEQLGFEEQARDVRVSVLACGHQVVR